MMQKIFSGKCQETKQMSAKFIRTLKKNAVKSWIVVKAKFIRTLKKNAVKSWIVVKAKFNDANIYVKAGVVSVGVLIVILMAFSIFHSSKAHAMPEQRQVAKQEAFKSSLVSAISNLQNSLLKNSSESTQRLSFQLSQLNDNLAKGFNTAKGSVSDKDIKTLQGSIEKAIDNLNNNVKLSEQRVANMLANLQMTADKISKQQASTPSAVIKASALPFKVMSVDWWNGQEKANVQNKSNGEYGLISIGQNYQGWILFQINNGKSKELIFTNENNQAVRIFL